MVTVLIVLSAWVLLNILFVLIMVPPRKPRRPSPPATLAPAPIDRTSASDLDPDEPLSLRHVVMSVAMGTFFVLVPPLLALRDAIVGFFKKIQGGNRAGDRADR